MYISRIRERKGCILNYTYVQWIGSYVKKAAIAAHETRGVEGKDYQIAML